MSACPLTQILLTNGWELQGQGVWDSEWLSVESVPTVVHLDLLKLGKIPDPFIGYGELDVEWIGERTWIYRTSFPSPQRTAGGRIDLVFEGLDTFAEVRLNGHTILNSENMFLEYRVDVGSTLKNDAVNVLELEFAPALLKGRELEKENSEYRFIAHNGETGRLGVRKAQYHWGWDWGPVFMTAGPWKPVRLEIFHSRIERLWVDYALNDGRCTLGGTLFATVSGRPARLRFVIEDEGESRSVFTETVDIDKGSEAKCRFTLENPKLWYPVGSGGQPLYKLSAEIIQDDQILNHVAIKTGFRDVELIRNHDTVGESFFFRINGIDVFCGGSCWIPADNFLPRLSEVDYRKWLQTLVEGNQNMIRVWGGGIYEPDMFYSICDELGILVWQDFMFACGSYPTWPSLLQNIKQEVAYNVRRLRDHPSVVVFAGTNEDYQIQEWYKLDYQESTDPQEWLKSSFPARFIYESLLPTVCGKEAPRVPYWPCSPFTGGGKDSGDQRIGDIHQWNVWHGTQEKYQRFPEIGGRFVSEFGMCSFPALETIRSFVKCDRELHAQSLTMDFHNKADGHERRIGTYLLENFRNTSDFETWVYLTQLMQAETVLYAYKGWRRQWGDSRRCGGALVWQLNDCWPCSSWAIVDYYHRKKIAYYTIKRAMRPLAVGVMREHKDWSQSHARPTKELEYAVWISSNQKMSFAADLEIRFISIASGKDVKPSIVKSGITVVENGTTEVLKGMVDGTWDDPYAVVARLLVNGECISRDADWPQPYKYIHFEERGLSLQLASEVLTVTVNKPVKGFTVEEQEGVALSDNGIDVFPDDQQTITLKGYRGTLDQLRYKILK
ncbi:glycoside hydrolase [Pseudovirgaria hyperparasitica]|uniref:Beta-mannosidase B n=1 Tax=Pseudovirgaria hyperparasitica TaxID=470096 RepID=A0A6A6WN77_9PEZI|nr:glycoside hydrolase [Pseudovirgaria hyperparasitica]KAF2763536.1 glycoside hydrolase [Pseudovirgaria hyperparasitica]